MEQTAKISGSIRVPGLNYAWEASIRADEEDCTNYAVESSSSVFRVGDSFESAVDEQLLTLFLRNVEDAMPRTDAEDDTSSVDYAAQLNVGDSPILVKAPGDGFVTLVAPNGASVRLGCREFLRWSSAVVTTTQQLQPPREPRYRKTRRR